MDVCISTINIKGLLNKTRNHLNQPTNLTEAKLRRAVTDMDEELKREVIVRKEGIHKHHSTSIGTKLSNAISKRGISVSLTALILYYREYNKGDTNNLKFMKHVRIQSRAKNNIPRLLSATGANMLASGYWELNSKNKYIPTPVGIELYNALERVELEYERRCIEKM